MARGRGRHLPPKPHNCSSRALTGEPPSGWPSGTAGSVLGVAFSSRGAPVDSAIEQRRPAVAGLREAPEPPSNFTPPADAPQPPPPSRPQSAWPDESYRGWSGLWNRPPRAPAALARSGAAANRRRSHRRPWLAVTRGRPSAASTASITPTARKPLPPNEDTVGASGDMSGTASREGPPARCGADRREPRRLGQHDVESLSAEYSRPARPAPDRTTGGGRAPGGSPRARAGPRRPQPGRGGADAARGARASAGT